MLSYAVRALLRSYRALVRSSMAQAAKRTEAEKAAAEAEAAEAAEAEAAAAAAPAPTKEELKEQKRKMLR
eukprot:SAG11_NODE_29018_length_315_cov_0.958333_2_plen_69_part_01